MITELLDIQPRELEFVFELKKQTSCSVRLVNKSDHHVAFKVKTTSPKKYCVRPNTGVIKPRLTCDFTVTMQAPRSAPADIICKDKFLIQSTVVPVETLDGDITASTFAKDGKYVEEIKLRVILVSPPHSPVLSPINGTLKQVPDYEASLLKDQVLSGVETLISHDTPTRSTGLSHNNGTLKQVPASEVSSPKDQVLNGVEAPFQVHSVTGDVLGAKIGNGAELKAEKGVEVKKMTDLEEVKLVNDIEQLKSKLNVLESKLTEAEVTISKLTEERRLTAQEREILREELASLSGKKSARQVQAGFPLLFVIMVALVSIVLGHLMRH